MSPRWVILSVLFIARTGMAFQFQSAAAVSPALMAAYDVALTDIGILIGLYLAPGVAVAIPGGSLAAWLGEKRIVLISLGVMILGGLMAFGPGWGWLTTGRAIAGMGGVVINIVMTKMVVDWFAGREISTAMAIFINSWPLGIALALLTLPLFAATGGLALAWGATTGLIVVAMALVALVYRAPDGAAPSAPVLRMARFPVWPLLLAALIWALYNTALAILFSFGPALLIAGGWSEAWSGAATSGFMLSLALFIPLGGILADRTGRRNQIIAFSLLSYALLIPLVAVLPATGTAVLFLVLGALFALGGGPIVTQPALVLPQEARAFGMGVYFAVYYAVMMLAPSAGGGLADATGHVSAAFLFGVGCCVLCLFCLAAFRAVMRAS